MKSISTFILFFALSLNLHAQWEALDFPEGVQFPDIEEMYALVSHDNALYASSFNKRIQKSTDQGMTWSAIPLFPFPSKVTTLVSAGDRLYAAKTSSFAEGTIYYTEDDGVTWELDTIGMPNHIFYATSKADIKDMIFCDGHLIATFDNADAYYIKKPSEQVWVKNDFLAANDPRTYSCMNESTLLVGADDRFYFSADLDGDFSTPANTNLETFFVTDVVATNGSRIFLVGKAFNDEKQSLYYSDDMGETWINIDITSIIAPNVFNGFQSIIAMYAEGNAVYLAMDQDATNTAPDVYYSSDGGLTYTSFNGGLPDDEFGTDAIQKFINHENSIYGLGVFKDVYRSDGTVSAKSITPKNILSLFPNPTDGWINIELSEKNELINIYDAWGRLLIEEQMEGQIDLSAFPAGIYLAKSTGGALAKIVKR